MNEVTLETEIAERKSEVLRKMTDVTFYPALVETEVGVANYTKLPISRITALGTYLAEFTKHPGYLGAYMNANNQVAGQATLNPLVCNPTMLFMAAALVNIDKKLDAIQEMQKEFLDFLVQKERSELKGDLNFLSDVLNNYKHNWNNTMYKNSNHIKVLDIRQAAERKIDFYREQITVKVNKKSFIHSDKDVKKQSEKVQEEFNDYQLAVYLFAFSSFLEVMLLENYASAYLNGISKKIEKYSFEYKELYTKCYDLIEGYSNSSIQSAFVRGFIGCQSSCVRPFIENINNANQLYNNSVEFLIDKENVYIGTDIM